MRFATSVSHFSFPASQSKLLVWSARSLGTSSGSAILAKEIRRGLSVALLVLLVVLAVREGAKRRPSTSWTQRCCAARGRTGPSQTPPAQTQARLAGGGRRKGGERRRK